MRGPSRVDAELTQLPLQRTAIKLSESVALVLQLGADIGKRLEVAATGKLEGPLQSRRYGHVPTIASRHPSRHGCQTRFND